MKRRVVSKMSSPRMSAPFCALSQLPKSCSQSMPGSAVSCRWSMVREPYEMKPSAALRPCPGCLRGSTLPRTRNCETYGPTCSPG
jgi:hypothetical protein